MVARAVHDGDPALSTNVPAGRAPRAAIIGEGTLPISCGEILLRKGFEIVAVISPDDEVRRWARSRGLEARRPGEEWTQVLERAPFDYLFSIVNYTILPEALLALPTAAAINYHDAPLPRYAGMHATSWAILNGEQRHGITWHVAVELVDGGDILAQVTFEVGPRDTALELNLRCYEAAVGSFEDLAEQLAHGHLRRTPQDLSARTYYGLHQRPDAAALLDWREPAEKLDAMVRGLDFGPYPNALGLAKLDLGEDVLHVSAAELQTDRLAENPPARAVQGDPGNPAANPQPGVVLAASAKELVIAAKNGALAITQLRRLDGTSVDLASVIEKHDFRAGTTLPVLEDADRATIGRINSELAKHENYWVSRLAQLRPVPLPRLTGTSSAELEKSIAFDADALLERFAEPVARRSDLIVSAFVLYLTRLTASEGFDLGFWDAERAQRLRLPRNLLADWVPLPVAADLEAPFADLVRNLSRRLEESRRRGSYLHEVVARHPRIQGVTPTYSVAVAMDPANRTPVEATGTFLAWHPAPPMGCILLLELNDDGRNIAWRYDPSAFSAGTIKRMAAEFELLLESAAASFDRASGDIDLVPPADLHSMDELNRTDAAYERDACVHDLIEKQVDRTPDRVAALFEGRSLTYAELDARSNQIASYLGSLGVHPGSLVGVFIDRSLEMLTAIVGILKSGAGYVPLDPLYPPDRIAFMIEDSGCSVVLAQKELLSRLTHENLRTVLVDAEPSPFESFSTARHQTNVCPSNTAYVIYTSGSTGRPKGVVVPHRGVVNLLSSMQKTPGIRPDDVLVAVTTICFDISVLEMFLPLVSGARVAIVPRTVAEDGRALARSLSDHGATLFQATPATYRLLLESRWKGVPGLRNLCGGEPLPRELANAILERTAELWNCYGPTETTVYSTTEQIKERVGPISIGRAIENTSLHIVDRRLRRVPFGCTGELLIGGDGVVSGYHARPDLTSERFVTVQFNGRAERVYRTGDLARYLPDGRIECLGRIDHQVKIRGFRIELGEIESILDGHPDVQGSAVVAREDTPGDPRLVAYAVPRGTAVDRDRLLQDLRERTQRALPLYMVPSAFVVLDELPLTRNGKIDRNALPKPDRTSSLRSATTTPPRGALELAIAEVWKEALGVEQVGRTDDFFELGGHSLTVQRLRTLLEERTGRIVSTLDLFRAPTVASLAARLEGVAVDSSGEVRAREHEVAGHRSFLSKMRLAMQRHLVPQFVSSLYYLFRYGAKVSPRAEVELSPLLTFGKGCIVDSFTKIKATDGPVRFGNRCGIATSCFISGSRQGILIGDNFLCGPNVTLVSNAYLFDKKGVHFWDQGHVSLGIRIGNNVWLGASVIVLDGSELGDDTIVVAGSVVDRKHPDGVILRGNPAEIVAYR
jgi:amino acid adenylation domain-containing protein